MAAEREPPPLGETRPADLEELEDGEDLFTSTVSTLEVRRVRPPLQAARPVARLAPAGPFPPLRSRPLPSPSGRRYFAPARAPLTAARAPAPPQPLPTQPPAAAPPPASASAPWCFPQGGQGASAAKRNSKLFSASTAVISSRTLFLCCRANIPTFPLPSFAGCGCVGVGVCVCVSALDF